MKCLSLFWVLLGVMVGVYQSLLILKGEPAPSPEEDYFNGLLDQLKVPEDDDSVEVWAEYAKELLKIKSTLTQISQRLEDAASLIEDLKKGRTTINEQKLFHSWRDKATDFDRKEMDSQESIEKANQIDDELKFEHQRYLIDSSGDYYF